MYTEQIKGVNTNDIFPQFTYLSGSQPINYSSTLPPPHTHITHLPAELTILSWVWRESQRLVRCSVFDLRRVISSIILDMLDSKFWCCCSSTEICEHWEIPESSELSDPFSSCVCWSTVDVFLVWQKTIHNCFTTTKNFLFATCATLLTTIPKHSMCA